MSLTYYCSFKLAALALVFSAMGASEAKADTIAFTAPGSLTYDTGAVNLGLVFTANTTFSVDALGIYDYPGLAGPEQVGLYNSSGNLLASATVTLTDPLISGYFFQSVTPVTLSAGSTYTVDVFVGNNPFGYGPAPTANGAVTYKGATYLYSSSLAFPTFTPSVPAFYGANFEIATGDDPPVPEPRNVGALVSLAMLAGCFCFRKAQSRASESSVATAQV